MPTRVVVLMAAILAGATNELFGSCEAITPFIDGAREADLVVVGEVLEVKASEGGGTRIRLRMVKSLRGPAPGGVVAVWGGLYSGMQGIDPKNFPSGSLRAVILETQPDLVPAGAFAFPTCAESWLAIAKDTPPGNISIASLSRALESQRRKRQ
jgi:hypothetical protein